MSDRSTLRYTERSVTYTVEILQCKYTSNSLECRRAAKVAQPNIAKVLQLLYLHLLAEQQLQALSALSETERADGFESRSSDSKLVSGRPIKATSAPSAGREKSTWEKAGRAGC